MAESEKRAVPKPTDVQLKEFKEEMEARLFRLEQAVGILIENQRQNQPQSPPIVIFKGKGKAEQTEKRE